MFQAAWRCVWRQGAWKQVRLRLLLLEDLLLSELLGSTVLLLIATTFQRGLQQVGQTVVHWVYVLDR